MCEPVMSPHNNITQAKYRQQMALQLVSGPDALHTQDARDCSVAAASVDSVTTVARSIRLRIRVDDTTTRDAVTRG